MRFNAAAGILSLALPILCLAAGTPPEPTQARVAKVEAAWVRWLPANVPLAGFATITNPSDRAIVLTAASSPAFQDVSIHRTIQIGGGVQMAPVDAITIAPHSTVDFAARGFHFMLMRSRVPLDSQRAVPITLRFADGSSLALEFEVRKEAGK